MARYGLNTTDAQAKGIFTSSMYQLVDVWAEDRHISYGTFMAWMFDNVAVWDDRQSDGKGAWVFAKMGRVECIGEKFEQMKEGAVSVHETFVGAEITAAADKARRDHDELQAKLAEEKRRNEKLSEENRKL